MNNKSKWTWKEELFAKFKVPTVVLENKMINKNGLQWKLAGGWSTWKNFTRVTWSTTNRTWPELASNQVFRSGKRVPNGQSQGVSMVCVCMYVCVHILWGSRDIALCFSAHCVAWLLNYVSHGGTNADGEVQESTLNYSDDGIQQQELMFCFCPSSIY